MRITVVGTGYVGLVSGVCFSELGFTVTCVDRDAAKIESLQAGKAPFYEPGLAEMMTKNVKAGRLRFATAFAEAEHAEAIFIAVGTPPGADGQPDTRALWSVVDSIKASNHPEAVIVVKSTLPPGSTREVGRRLPGHHAVSNPEFLREGSAIGDFMQPDRIVCGVSSELGRSVMERLYAPLNAKVFFTSPESSEMVKYAANDLLATRIAYINEIADICEKVGADVVDVAQGIGMDKRIGPHFLRPGPGFGGSCFPKDVLAIVEIAKKFGTRSRILEATLESNAARQKAMAQKVIAACGGSVEGKTIAILGVTFKADTDDMRDAPSLVILPALVAAGAKLKAYDPEGMDMAKPMLPAGIEWCASTQDALKGAEAAVIVTEWNVFRTLDLPEVKSLLATPLVVDLRNMFDLVQMRDAGLRYVSVGRPVLDDQIEVAAQRIHLVKTN